MTEKDHPHLHNRSIKLLMLHAVPEARISDEALNLYLYQQNYGREIMSVYQRIHREHRVRQYKHSGRRPVSDEPPAMSAWINIQGRIKRIAADTPDELLHKLSRVLAKEGIDVWAILTKKKQ